jgi:hypothetical protein
MSATYTMNVPVAFTVQDDVYEFVIRHTTQEHFEEMILKLVQVCFDMGNAKPDGSTDNWAYLSLANAIAGTAE